MPQYPLLQTQFLLVLVSTTALADTQPRHRNPAPQLVQLVSQVPQAPAVMRGAVPSEPGLQEHPWTAFGEELAAMQVRQILAWLQVAHSS